jgi:hypothetical protein
MKTRDLRDGIEELLDGVVGENKPGVSTWRMEQVWGSASDAFER